MKRCPDCGRDYNDDSMSFCLDDGSGLLFGPAFGSESGAISTGFPADEPQTAILHSTAAPGEAATRAQIYTTEKTAMLPSSIAEVPKRRGFDKRLLLAPLAVAVIVAGGFWGFRYFNTADAAQINSIAVLPFENRSGNPDTEYLSDGLGDSLIYRLTRLPNLKVSPTSSVIRYKGRQSDVAEVAKELEVDAVMSGKLAQRGDDLTISVELTDARTKKLIWAEQYNRKMADLLTTQREIAVAITEKLQLKLGADDSSGITKKYTDNTEAYQAYLRGRYFWNKRSKDDFYKAMEQFQKSVELDPAFALAYVGIADSYNVMPNESISFEESMSQAEAYARKAIDLDGQLAEPHATLGSIYYKQWQWAESEAEFKRSIELNPNYATAYHWYSILLFGQGRFDEGDSMINRAYELDPMSSIINQNVAQVYLRKRDYQKAIEICQKVLDVEPNFRGARYAIAWALLRSGRTDEAIKEFENVIPNNRFAYVLAGLGAAYATAGRTKEALEIAREIEKENDINRTQGYSLAVIYGALGDKERAFTWLERAFAVRAPILSEIRWLPHFDPLKDDPLFKDLLKRMGLPE